jgi:transketolase
VLLSATGSEVHLAVEAVGVAATGDGTVVAIEAGVRQGWAKYVGPAGDIVGLEGFGASAHYKMLMEKFGFTPEKTVVILPQV